MTGELRIRAFGFSTFAKVWASPANAGARELADELVAAFSGLTVSTAEEAGDATHMLLYLNEDSFSDERLAEQVKQARQDRLKIVMAHENDLDRGGCEFAKFFETTPQERCPPAVHRLCHTTRPLHPPLPRRRRSSSTPGSTTPSPLPASPACTMRCAPPAAPLPQRPPPEATDLAPPVSQVSLVLLAKALGATPVSARSSIRDSLSNIGRFTTAPRGSTTSDPVVTEEDSQLEQLPEVEQV